MKPLFIGGSPEGDQEGSQDPSSPCRDLLPQGEKGALFSSRDLLGLFQQLQVAAAEGYRDVLAHLRRRAGVPDRAVATSKTFRSLARICGAPPSGDGPLTRRALPLAGLREWIPKLVHMDLELLSALPGVSARRAHQIVPGALVAEACMDIFDLPELEICPWALREGVILERLDHLSFLGD